VGVAVLASLVCAPADAHDTDPRIVCVLDEIRPVLPQAVVLQVRPGIAEEIVAQNPTSTPLVVLGADDRPFLRISHDGVQADLNSADWYLTNSPTGTGPLPATAVKGAPARWLTVSAGDSWGWFDHRLHPERLDLPSNPRQRTRVGEWQVPVEYGGQRSRVVGHLDLVPLLGSFTVTADPAPPGLTVSLLAGRLPGLFLTAPGGEVVVVFGSDGRPFFRLGPKGVEVDEGSPSWADDQRARGREVTAVATRPRWRKLAGTPAVTWLDPRLRYPHDLPPDPSVAQDLQRWSIALTVDGKRAGLGGVIRWTPAAHQPAADSSSGRARAFTVVGVLLLALALSAGVSAWRRASARRTAA
jgi:hypothetical protein